MSDDGQGPPLHASECSFKNLWQKYYVHPDRLVLRCWLALHTFVIRADDVEELWLGRGPVIGDWFRGRGFRGAFALKLNVADLYTHVGLRRKTGLFKRICFTPDRLEMFLSVCRSAFGLRVPTLSEGGEG